MGYQRRPSRRARTGAPGAVALASLLVAACGTGPAPGPTATSRPVPTPGTTTPVRLTTRVIATYPHDPSAFTQGLQVREGEELLESTGLYGESSVREVDLTTGTVSRQRDLAPELFAEGLAIVGDRVFQLTWREGIALMHAAGDLSPLGAVGYEGEGWGLCYDGARLVMSDGSDRLTFRDPVTFDVVGGVDVAAAGQPVERLNELECAESLVYANVWQTDRIVAIDPGTGAVTAIIDASGLLSPEERAGADVLNGIAWRPETGTFLVTGKLWPKLFEVEWVDLGASPTGSAP